MTTKKKASVAGKVLANPKGSKAAKSLAGSVLTQRSQSKSYSVTAKSGKAISRTVATHRDALKRLADR
ncbi:MAG: hypothetical protein WA790_13600 [Sulfitobacter sp.]